MTKRLVILDQGLSQKAGHYFEYDYALALEAQKQNIDVHIYTHKNWSESFDFITPYFSVSIGSLGTGRDKAHAFLAKLPKSVRELLYKPARLFYRALTEFKAHSNNQFVAEIAQLSLNSDDVILIPNASYDDALNLAGTDKAFNILFRQLPQSRSEEKRLMQLLHKDHTNLTIWTDTDDLTQWLTARGLKASTLPIPMHVPTLNIQPATPYTFAILGPARSEKNTQMMPDLIRDFEQELRDDKVVFVVQTTCIKGQIVEPIIDKTINELKRLVKELPNIRLIDHELSQEEFYTEIAQSSCLLIPYNKERYQNRSSGLLVQALLCGRPAIVPRETWMAGQLPSELSRYIWDNDLVKTCRNVFNTKPDMTAIQKEWRAKHSARKCINLLMK